MTDDQERSKNNDRTKITIKLLLEQYSGDYKPKEVDCGKPRGKEVW